MGVPIKQLAHPLLATILLILQYQLLISQFRSFLPEYQLVSLNI